MGLSVAIISPWMCKCGIYTYARDLANGLASHGVEVYIVRLPRFGAKNNDILLNVLSKIPLDKIDLIHCFPAQTPILTTDGIKNIEDVTEKDHLYTHTGKIGTIIHRFQRPYEGKVLSITAKYNDPIKCTPEHPFLIIKKPWKDNHTTRLFRKRIRKRVDTPDLKPRWLPAKDITIGDYVVLPRLKQMGQIIEYLEPGLDRLPKRSYEIFKNFVISKARRQHQHLIDTKIPLTEAVCRLIGLYIAEGSSRGCQVRFSFNVNEEETLAKDVQETIAFMGCQNKASVYRVGNGMTLTFSSRPIADLLTRLCGKGARNKHLPSWWLALSDVCLSELLKGVWQGDGCIQNDGFSIASHSQTLREQLRLAYNRFGIVAGVHPTCVSVCGAGIKKLEKLWRVKHPATSKFNFRDFAEINDDFIAYRICGKEEECYKGDVFNFEVDSDNSYLVMGYAVHNCQHEYGLYQGLEASFFGVLKRLGKPVVTTMHAVGQYGLDVAIAEASSRVIVHNEFCRKNFGFPSTIIAHGTKPVKCPPIEECKKTYGVNPKIPIVGYVGFISNYKGIETLIEAVSKIPNVALVIGGGWHIDIENEYIAKLKELSSTKLGGRSQWLGFIPDEKLATVYGGFDMVAYCSRFMTESGGLLMALSHGKAVVCSDLPPAREKAKQGALMTFKDADDMVEKIKLILKDDALRRKLEDGARRYAYENRWEIIAQKHIDLYNEVLSDIKKTVDNPVFPAQ